MTTIWRTASRSAGNGQCVEVATGSHGALVRDSKDPAGPMLAVGADQWRRFIDTVKAGDMGGE